MDEKFESALKYFIMLRKGKAFSDDVETHSELTHSEIFHKPFRKLAGEKAIKYFESEKGEMEKTYSWSVYIKRGNL